MDLVLVLAFALLPAAGNLVGALVAEGVRSPRWVVGVALHAAAGIAVALVAIDLMPRILGTIPMWRVSLAFVAGALFTVLLARAARWLQQAMSLRSGKALMVYVAIGADLFGDGLMTGTGAAVETGVGLLVSATQSVANVPGGFAAAANLRGAGASRGKRVGLALAVVVPVLASAALGFWVLDDAGREIQSTALAFVCGVLLLATVEDVLPQGDAPDPPRWISTLAFALGFVGLSLVTAYV